MSEDDVDMMAVDGQGPGKVDRDRRAPRFSWTPAYEATFFRSLCESVQLGLRENSSFKAEAWERATQALQESHGALPTKNHLINKSDNARKRFRLWRGLREDPDFVYNPKARTVTATEEAWRAHIEREPLSRALRGRPFDHEDYMETLYPDVIGSGGAPKRVMKPKRRDDQPGEESELAGANSSVPSSDQTAAGQQPSDLGSPGAQPAPGTNVTGSSSAGSGRPGCVTPSTTALASAAAQGSALTPPEDTTTTVNRKRGGADLDGSPSAADTPSRPDRSQARSPEKRIRFSASDDASFLAGAPPPLPLSLDSSSAPPTSAGVAIPHRGSLGTESSGGPPAARPGAQELLGLLAAGGGSAAQWREKAVDLFYRDFGSEELELQVRIPQDLLSNEHTAMVFCKMPCQVREHWKLSRDIQTPIPVSPTNYPSLPVAITMSYAEAASKGPKQSPSEAAAPPLPEIIPNESASTSSLIDVDMPSVHTVPSDFLKQDVQTETQANRLEREMRAARTKSNRVRRAEAARAKKADSWITRQFSRLSDGEASGVALANLATFVGVGSYLGYRAWRLHEKGNLDGKAVGLGVGILAALSAAQAVVGRYLYRGKKN